MCTALALMAAGVAVVQLISGFDLVGHALGILLITLAGVLAGVSDTHRRRTALGIEGVSAPSSADPFFSPWRHSLCSPWRAEPTIRSAHDAERA